MPKLTLYIDWRQPITQSAPRRMRFCHTKNVYRILFYYIEALKILSIHDSSITISPDSHNNSYSKHLKVLVHTNKQWLGDSRFIYWNIKHRRFVRGIVRCILMTTVNWTWFMRAEHLSTVQLFFDSYARMPLQQRGSNTDCYWWRCCCCCCSTSFIACFRFVFFFIKSMRKLKVIHFFIWFEIILCPPTTPFGGLVAI